MGSVLIAVLSDPTSGTLVVCLYLYKYEKILNERHEIPMFYFKRFTSQFIHINQPTKTKGFAMVQGVQNMFIKHTDAMDFVQVIWALSWQHL